MCSAHNQIRNASMSMLIKFTARISHFPHCIHFNRMLLHARQRKKTAIFDADIFNTCNVGPCGGGRCIVLHIYCSFSVFLSLCRSRSAFLMLVDKIYPVIKCRCVSVNSILRFAQKKWNCHGNVETSELAFEFHINFYEFQQMKNKAELNITIKVKYIFIWILFAMP